MEALLLVSHALCALSLLLPSNIASTLIELHFFLHPFVFALATAHRSFTYAVAYVFLVWLVVVVQGLAHRGDIGANRFTFAEYLSVTPRIFILWLSVWAGVQYAGVVFAMVFTGIVVSQGGAIYMELFKLPSFCIAATGYRVFHRKPAYASKPLKGGHVNVIVCCKNEAAVIVESVTSIRRSIDHAAARMGKTWTFSLVLADGESTDGTVSKVCHLVDQIYTCGGGKLNARNETTAHLDSDIIVSFDGDRAYEERCVYDLVHALGQGDVPLVGRYYDMAGLNGGASAIITAYARSYPFLLVTNARWTAVWIEEELTFSFAHRGRFVDVPYRDLRPFSTRELVWRDVQSFYRGLLPF